MGADADSRNAILSRLAAELFIKSKGDEELSSKIRRLREEIIKAMESEDTVFGQLHALLESLREIVPEERQRYHVALKALSTTSRMSGQEIVKAINNQLEELKILEKGLLSPPPGLRDEFKVMEAKSREASDEIAKLREKLGRLENEERELLNGMAAQKKEMEVVEKAVGEIFADIRTEIAALNQKVEELTVDRTAAQPAPPPDSIQSPPPVEEKEVIERKSELPGPPAAQGTEWQKKCPMCGGQMNFHIREQVWVCYVCAYEEP